MSFSEQLFARARPAELGFAAHALWIIVTIAMVAMAWANWATLDEQVRATGEVIVSSRSQVVQAVDGGVLSVMHVKEGDIVVAGDILAELDRVRFSASAEEMRAKTINLKANAARLTAELTGNPLEFSEEVIAEPQLVKRQTDLHYRRLRQQRQESESIEKSLLLAKEELGALNELASTGDASQSEVLNARRQVVDLQAELINRKNEYRRDAQEQLAANQSELE